MTPRRGATLVELIVTLVILAIISSVTVLAVRRFDAPTPGDLHAMIADTLRAVLASGRPATIYVLTDSGPAWSTIRADGSVVADSSFDVEPLTGAPRRAP
ncbi:MAG: pilus assembly FimT family protein [Gemmatimonadaceae bacterium]